MMRRLLTPDEYRRVVEEGRAAEVLARFVLRPPGRAPSGEALTPAEKQRRYRERKATAKKSAAEKLAAKVSARKGGRGKA